MKDAVLESGTMFFFDKKPVEYDVYKQVEEKILGAFPDVKIEVKKTQISFKSRYMFSCVSLPRTKKGMPPNAILVTFSLPYQVHSPRIFAATEPYPNRWTHHVAIGQDDFDEELFGWIKEAHDFSDSPYRR